VARDPVCGMNVRDDNRNNNLRSEHRGQNYYFCSDRCRQEFDRNPDNFTRDNNDQNRNDNRSNLRNNRDNRDRRNDNRPR
jgi:YHS domain-containing protein